MRFWRACVADPWSGGLIAVAVVLFVALQGFAVGVSEAGGPTHQRIIDGFVVCALTGAKLAPAAPNTPLPADDRSHLCCCSLAILGPHAKLFVTATLVGVVLLLLREIGPAGLWSSSPRTHRRRGWRIAGAGPRAPPLPSV